MRACAARRLAMAGDGPLPGVVQARSVIAHRHPWFAARAAEAFNDLGVDVALTTDNGAEAVGASIAEQPDIALLGDTLVMQTCAAVVQDIRRYSPTTLIGVHGSDPRVLASLLDSGADLVLGTDLSAMAAVRRLVDAC